jgi:hypothetical protein
MSVDNKVFGYRLDAPGLKKVANDCLPMAEVGVSHVRGEGVHGYEVFFFETRMLVENILLGHAVGSPPKDVIHGDPHSANAGLAVPLVGFDRDARVNRRHRINSLSRMFLIRACSERYNGFVAKPTKRAAVKRNGHVANEQSKVSELGRELDKFRARYIAAGGKLLNRRELEREIAERRGLR